MIGCNKAEQTGVRRVISYHAGRLLENIFKAPYVIKGSRTIEEKQHSAILVEGAQITIFGELMAMVRQRIPYHQANVQLRHALVYLATEKRLLEGRIESQTRVWRSEERI